MSGRKSKQSAPRKASKLPTIYVHEGTNFTEVVRKQVSAWAKEKPREVVVGTASSGKSLTRNAISVHVQKGTDLGQRLVKGFMDAAVRSVLNAKIKG